MRRAAAAAAARALDRGGVPVGAAAAPHAVAGREGDAQGPRIVLAPLRDQQVRRAFGSSAPGTADLLKVAVVVSELRYFAPDEGIGLDPAARYAVWARTDRQHLAAFNAQKRGAKELREMLLQTAVGAASYSPVARFLYTRESATFFESVLLLQLCQKVMSRGDQTAALPPEPGFGVKLSEAAARDVLPILTVPGGGHPSAKRLNLALARCPELGRRPAADQRHQPGGGGPQHV